MSDLISNLNQMEKDNTIEELTSMYEKVCLNMKLPDSKSVTDLYTLYDCLSFILSTNMSYGQIEIHKANSAKLQYAIKDVKHEPDTTHFKSMFFENGKVPTCNINLEGAMLSAGFSETEKNLWRRIAADQFKMTPGKSIMMRS
jgi:hypothetical protein